MKNLKLGLLIAISALSLSCKKNTIAEKVANNTDRLPTENAIKHENVNGYFGECTENMADSIANWVHTYGAGGEKENDASGALDAMSDISRDRYNCQDGPDTDNSPSPIDYPPPAYETAAINSAEELLRMLGITDLCNFQQVAAAKSKIDPINIIVSRAINAFGSGFYYDLNIVKSSFKFYQVFSQAKHIF